MILVETDGERWLVSPYGLVGWVHNVHQAQGFVAEARRHPVFK